MENKVDFLLDKISEHVKEMVKTETIIGEEFKMGEYTCKPVIKVGIGFGSAGGSGNDRHHGEGNGGGAGAGIGISPVGFLASKDGEITFIPAYQKRGLGILADKLPDILEKVMDMKDKKDKQEGTDKKEKQ
jgi:uncharacterized spore protein YtfJ